MFKGFKDFLLRGNVIDLSVAVVIGAAFTDVVTAFTNSFLKPLIQLLSPGVGEFAGTVRVDDVVFDYATVINQTITFIITAAVVYFLVVAPMKAIQTRRLRGEESGPAQPTDVELLVQIRDLLEDQATAGRRPTSISADDRFPAERVPAGVGAVADANSTSPVLPPTRMPGPAAPAPARPHPAMADAGASRRARPVSSAPPPQYAEMPAGQFAASPSGTRHAR
jgi:large conductance mechanosensitive channel